ncbi:MAG: DUF503 family protein [Candidatus Aminicenantes bacterium]|nr:DUF503 family protein [Candidatus Aminicenantes bacterium]
MIIGYLCIEIYLPYSHSLKEKRKRLKSYQDRLKKRFNVSFAELDYQNKWQRAKIGMVAINSRKAVIEKAFNQLLREAEQIIEGEVISKEIDFF